MTDKERILLEKEEAIVSEIIGRKVTEEDFPKIKRVFKNFLRGGQYILNFDDKDLGYIKYSFVNNECIIKFEKNINT